MAYGNIKADKLVYDNNGTDTEVNISSLGPARTDSDIDGRISNAVTTQVVQGYDANNAVTDTAQTFTAGQRGTITELNAGTSFDLNFASSNNFLIQPNGTFTVTLNATGLSGSKGQCGSIFIKYQSGATTSGSFPTTMKFVGGAAGITLTGTGIDRIDYIVQDDTSGSEVITCNVTNNYVA